MKVRLLLLLLFLSTSCRYEFYDLNGERIRVYSYSSNLLNKNNIQALSFDNSFASSFPNEVFKFSDLKVLSLRNNLLERLPNNIDQLNNLEVLFIDGNPITELPASVTGLSELKILTINHTKIKTFPQDISKLNLRTLLIGTAPIDSATRLRLKRELKGCNIIESVD